MELQPHSCEKCGLVYALRPNPDNYKCFAVYLTTTAPAPVSCEGRITPLRHVTGREDRWVKT